MPLDFSQGGEIPRRITRYAYRFELTDASGGQMVWTGRGYPTRTEAEDTFAENLPWIAEQMPKRPWWAFWREEPVLPNPKDYVYSYQVTLPHGLN